MKIEIQSYRRQLRRMHSLSELKVKLPSIGLTIAREPYVVETERIIEPYHTERRYHHPDTDTGRTSQTQYIGTPEILPHITRFDKRK
jgi:hypothetical protein